MIVASLRTRAGARRPMDPAGSMENTNRGVFHSSLDGANNAPPTGRRGPAAIILSRLDNKHHEHAA